MNNVIFDFLDKHPDVSIHCDYHLTGHTVVLQMDHEADLHCSHMMQLSEIMAKYPDDVDRYVRLILEEMYHCLFFGGNMRPMCECVDDDRKETYSWESTNTMF